MKKYYHKLWKVMIGCTVFVIDYFVIWGNIGKLVQKGDANDHAAGQSRKGKGHGIRHLRGFFFL